MIINLFCCSYLNAQSKEVINDDSYNSNVAYNVAQRQHDIGVKQSNLANKWGIATVALSGTSLIGYATTQSQSSTYSLSYWCAMASMGTAAVGLVIKLSSFKNISPARSQIDTLNYDKYKGFGSLDFGATENGIGFTYIF